MNWWRKFVYWLTVPKRLHCKPLMSSHEWQAPYRNEAFPVCMHCGTHCWWLRGYTLNSGTVIGPDYDAIAVADNSRLTNVPWDSKP